MGVDVGDVPRATVVVVVADVDVVCAPRRTRAAASLATIRFIRTNARRYDVRFSSSSPKGTPKHSQRREAPPPPRTDARTPDRPTVPVSSPKWTSIEVPYCTHPSAIARLIPMPIVEERRPSTVSPFRSGRVLFGYHHPLPPSLSPSSLSDVRSRRRTRHRSTSTQHG